MILYVLIPIAATILVLKFARDVQECVDPRGKLGRLLAAILGCFALIACSSSGVEPQQDAGSCLAPLVECDGTCSNLAEPDNCGACGVVCPSVNGVRACVDGQCLAEDAGAPCQSVADCNGVPLLECTEARCDPTGARTDPLFSVRGCYITELPAQTACALDGCAGQCLSYTDNTGATFFLCRLPCDSSACAVATPDCF